MLSTTTIDNVRDLPIEQIIQQYATLKKAGLGWVCNCPLPGHSEKTPSFHVSPQKGIFKCFGCGEGGDGIKFIMLKENLPWIDAVRLLAKEHGIAIVETEVKGKTPEQIDEEKEMQHWVDAAQVKYRKELVERPSVVKYLLGPKRNLSRASVIEWQLGVVPDWRIITPDLISAGKFEIGEKAGLVRKKSEEGMGLSAWDFMHHRITVPIYNSRGVLMGFGGRIYGDAEGPKYMNPPESPLYDKSKTLFGLDKAIKHFKTHGMATLVEGYFDVIKLHERGFNNTVSTSGTALTEGQAKQLRRYTDTVLVLRDGDAAGIKALKRDVPILLQEQFTVIVCELPLGEDPDTLFDKPYTMMQTLLRFRDGVDYLCGDYFAHAVTSGDRANAIDKVVKLLSSITSMVRRDEYTKSIAAQYKLKPADLTRPLTKLLTDQAKAREDERLAALGDVDEFSAMPSWVDRKQLEHNGFVQLMNDTTGFRGGIYFLNVKNRQLYRVTNFTIKPLYHIYDPNNSRRLIEVDNQHKNRVVEMPTQAFINQAMFEVELAHKGNFRAEEFMGKSEFKRITGWLFDAMPIAYELKTLGWQPEGFFAYSNNAYHNDQLISYDELGMLKVEDKFFMSLGNSKIHHDERGDDNPYVNDLFLKYMPPRADMNFSRWAHLFNESFGANAPFGIAFTFLTVFKDIVTRISKMPMLYCYGQKGSGKSAMAESIMWLFFSGKDADGNLIKGFNMNPGQSTPFSYFNRLERFRNCPILLNEFDEAVNEPWKTGALKAAYDGEGREVGDGSTGKARKTKIQKVNGTLMIVGQYLAVKDDAAVSSRSIACQFSLERLKSLTPTQINNFKLLQDAEKEGLSGTLIELLKLRPEVQKHLARNFSEVQGGLMAELRSEGYRIEARLISNYSLMLAATKTITVLGIQLPYSYETFYAHAKDRMIKHNQTLKDNSIVNQFWKSLEVLFDQGIIQTNSQIKIQEFPNGITIKEGSKQTKEDAPGAVLLVRFSNVYSLYAKYHRERTGQAAQSEETLLMYLKEQTYFIGLTPSETFSDKRTSAYAFNYEAMQLMGIGLEKNHSQTAPAGFTPKSEPPAAHVKGTDDLPF